MREDLVVVSLEPWDEVWRRNQHLVAGLLRERPGLHVLFVEPPTDRVHDLRRGAPLTVGRRLRALGPDDGVPEGRAWAYRPDKWLPRRIAPGGDERRSRRVVALARRLGMQRPVLWVNDPAGAVLLDVSGWPALYDITDDWLRAVRRPVDTVRLSGWEDRLLEACAEVVVCSPDLARSKSARRQVTLVPNAVDLAAYRSPALRPADLPDGECAVYVGTLHADRLDLEASVRLAAHLQHHDARLVFVGPVLLDPLDVTRLEAAGAVLLGARPAYQVPAYLQHASVLVVPHVVDDFTESLDPIKLYEYLAVGRPVISTPVAGFRDRGAGRVVTTSPAAMPQAALRTIEAARRGSVPPVAELDLPTWADRVQEMAEVLTRVRSGEAVPTRR
ncbi:glycosyltransferase family 1 protein [Cellulomonas hominis]|nr:glycosyltransferase family 1 protein [Cellulomonas hominis]